MIGAEVSGMDTTPKRSLRVWPGYAVVAIAAAALFAIWLPSDAPFRQMQVLRQLVQQSEKNGALDRSHLPEDARSRIRQALKERLAEKDPM